MTTVSAVSLDFSKEPPADAQRRRARIAADRPTTAKAWSVIASIASSIGSTPAAWRACLFRCRACNPVGDEALLLFVQRKLFRRFWRLCSRLGSQVGAERRCASGGTSFAGALVGGASKSRRPASVMM